MHAYRGASKREREREGERRERGEPEEGEEGQTFLCMKYAFFPKLVDMRKQGGSYPRTEGGDFMALTRPKDSAESPDFRFGRVGHFADLARMVRTDWFED